MEFDDIPCPRCEEETRSDTDSCQHCGDSIEPTGEDKYFAARQLVWWVGFSSVLLSGIVALGGFYHLAVGSTEYWLYFGSAMFCIGISHALLKVHGWLKSRARSIGA